MRERGTNGTAVCGSIGSYHLWTLASAPSAAADVPEWLRAAARDTLPAYEEKTDAVIMLDEFETRVKESGEALTVHLLAYKILRPTGREHAVFSVAFDSETDLTFLKTWSISGGWRASYLVTEGQERVRFVKDRFIGAFIGASIDNAQAENITDISKNLALHFAVKSTSYAKQAGDLLLVRPRLMGWKGEVAWEQGKDRTQPFTFDMTALHSDVFDITLPAGYSVEELPAEVTMAFDYGEYTSRAFVENQALHFARKYTINSLQEPPEKFGELRKFFGAIISDQLAIAVLKRPARQPAN